MISRARMSSEVDRGSMGGKKVGGKTSIGNRVGICDNSHSLIFAVFMLPQQW
jgi:hypothetical protein